MLTRILFIFFFFAKLFSQIKSVHHGQAVKIYVSIPELTSSISLGDQPNYFSAKFLMQAGRKLQNNPINSLINTRRRIAFDTPTDMWMS